MAAKNGYKLFVEDLDEFHRKEMIDSGFLVTKTEIEPYKNNKFCVTVHYTIKRRYYVTEDEVKRLKKQKPDN